VAPSLALLPNVAFAAVTIPREPALIDAKLDEATSVAEAVVAEAPHQQMAADAVAADAAATAADVAPGSDVVTATEVTSSSEVPAATDVAASAEIATASEVVIASETAVAPEAPALVEVWRPGGRSEERRPRHDRNRHRNQDRPAVAAQPAVAAGEADEGVKRERHGRGRRERHGGDFHQRPRTDAPAAAAAPAAPERAPVREPRDDRGQPPRERFQDKDRKGRDKGRDNKGRDKGKFGGAPKGGRDGRPDGGASHRQYATSAPPRERDRPVDPNSPFAKLAALKEQLTANRKDQH
jgi:ATP-dependent RNA helicase SUPV3L1/SUV3